MSHSGIYSADKMPWLAVNEGWPPNAPTQVQVILSDLCQMDCVDEKGNPWCAYRMPGYSSNSLFTKDAEVSNFGHNNPKRFMPTDRAMRLVDEIKAAGCRSIQWTGGGEPLLAPAHYEIMKHSQDIGLKNALVTNGLAFKDATMQLVSEFMWVRVSIDAGTADTYSKTRTTSHANFKRVFSHIRRIADLIAEKKSGCTLGVGFVVMPHNWREIIQCVVEAKIAGAHNIRLSAMFSPEDEKPYLDIYDDIAAEIAAAKDLETETFKIHDLFGDRISDLRLHNPDYDVCAKMHYCTYIGADMQAYVCCVYSYNDYGKVAGDLGNLKDKRFDEFWASDERKDFMARFDPRQCKKCQFNPQNRAMNALIGPPPAHMEFP